MSEHEVFKLKKELVDLRKQLEQAKNILKLKEGQLINLEEQFKLLKEADYQKNEADGLRMQLMITYEKLQEKERIIGEDDPEYKTKLEAKLKEKEDSLRRQIEIERELKTQLDMKEAINANYKIQLKEAAIKYKDDNIIQDAENYRDEILANRLKVQSLVEKNNKLNEQLEHLSAENRVLRKMAGVPDDYQFQLNDIIQEGQLQVEKYRAQVRILEDEVEELEEERARLRRRLRENVLGGQAEDDIEDDTNTRKKLRDQLQKLEDKNRRLEEEIQNLQDRQGGMTNQQMGNQSIMPNEHFEELQKQNKELKEHLTELFKQVSLNSNTQGEGYQPNQTGMSQKNPNLAAFQGLSMPPTPLPGAFGNYNDIKEGYSQRFQAKLPVDMSSVQGEAGLDQMQVKYEIASLQLQNIETLKLLQEKEKEYLNLQNEVDEIKEDVRSKCLLVQDELFVTYYKEKNEWSGKYGALEEQFKQQQEIIAEQKVKIERYHEFIDVQSKDPDIVKSKLAELTKRSAILDVNLIKLSRKYDSLREEYNQIKQSFITIQSDGIEREKDLMEKVYRLHEWKKTCSMQMKLMLSQLENSVSKEVHHIATAQLQYTQDKYANLQLRSDDYQKKISILESSERELYEKGERIRALEEELTEVQLEEEVIKKRLENLDPYFRKFQAVYTQMVDYIKLKNISPLQMFQMFDDNGDGKIQKNEFQSAIHNMGIPINPEEMDVLYMFVDLDGTGEIEYHEFIRRLRRSGVNVRKKEDDLLFTLYRAIQDAGLSLKNAFDAFDPNGDNIISKEDMKEVLDEMRINYNKEAVDYIFKVADTSGDNQISYDEFSALFEGIVKSSLQEEARVVVDELDWKMHVMIQIDAAVKEQNLTLLDAFKMIDKNDDQTVSQREFQQMFEDMRLNIAPDAIKDLFQQMDKNHNGEISYNEMLNYLRESKREQDKLNKLKIIQDRTNQLREQIQSEQQLQDIGKNTVMTMESRLQMKIAILEMREKNANQRSTALINQLSYSDNLIKEMNKQVSDLQSELEKMNETFYREREESMRLKERVSGSISKEESEKLKRINESFKLQNADLNSALTTYRSLYDSAVSQTKAMRLTIEKIKNDQDTLQIIIKEFQSNSDQNATIGKLFHQVMISRWNEGQTNQKYEKMLDDLRRMKLVEQSFEANMKEKHDEVQEQTSVFREASLSYEKQITELKAKMLPTVTLQRVEEQANKIKELAEMKFEVEKQNRLLREQFYELQLKADYFDIYKTKLDDLERRLKNSNPDDLSQQIIEVSEKLAEVKMEYLKSQRDVSMAKEKEDYYQRLNRQYTDTIKKLEFELSNSDLKLRKREEDWRRKFYDQRRQIFSQFGLTEAEQQQQADKNQANKDKLTELFHNKEKQKEKQLIQGTIQISQEEYQNLKLKIAELEDEARKNEIEYSGLLDRTKLYQQGSMPQQNIESYTRTLLQQEAEKMAMAAQQTIRTLQEIIKDKENQIDRKEKQIETVKMEAMAHKKKDLDEISRLSELVHAKKQDTLNYTAFQLQMPPSSIIPQEQQQPVLLQQYERKLQEKDMVIKELDINLQAEKKALKRVKDDLVKLLEDKEQLQSDLYTEQKKNESDKYQKRVETLQKVVNQKNKELQSVKNTVNSLKEEIFKISSETTTKEQEFKIKEGKLTNNTTEVEMRMRQSINEIKKLRDEIRDKNNELDALRIKEIEQRAKVTDLEKKNSELKAILGQSGNGGDVDHQVQTIQLKMQQANSLQIENATLAKEIQFLKSQGQMKNTFDKEGNLSTLTGQMYFKQIEEVAQAVKQYLATKPRINLFDEFTKIDKDRSSLIPMGKFFEVLGMVGIKFKKKQQFYIKFQKRSSIGESDKVQDSSIQPQQQQTSQKFSLKQKK